MNAETERPEHDRHADLLRLASTRCPFQCLRASRQDVYGCSTIGNLTPTCSATTALRSVRFRFQAAHCTWSNAEDTNVLVDAPELSDVCINGKAGESISHSGRPVYVF
jgi:hypothetical protein